MSKRNSLKLVPFTTRRHHVDGLRYDEWPEHRVLLEYTYGATGEQTSDGYGSNARPIEWLPNEPFTDTLAIDRLERGRSAARFWFVGSDGTHYPFFGQGLVDMLQRVTLDHGKVAGTFIAVKRGANYGIELYEGDAA